MHCIVLSSVVFISNKTESSQIRTCRGYAPITGHSSHSVGTRVLAGTFFAAVLIKDPMDASLVLSGEWYSK